ncbi:Tyrosine-protein kinase CpsD [Aquisphaera giovannonii]|uniref:Tyrosine-protein kinase CpsD n=1 Tax=Aquisphaera giovannonii TaxID=406548 RepID=A0A5B9VXB2_9BACT|nr:CpsD/CapB family tyrosine-protein kinase [Aquisphaera giovannonii]QEH32973.1 Tyrosine-protein kinase CpsD [Aquisphaera giovannonii]
MREVDEALSRAFARVPREAGGPVPPVPHWPPREGSPAPEPARVPAGPGHVGARIEMVDGRVIARHAPAGPGRGLDDADRGESVELRWPAVVQLLERRWGDRFEQMADRLIEARDRHNTRVLLFASCHRAEGRTTLVLTLSRALARRGGRTVLVDGDLAGPMLARSLGLMPAVGLDDVVDGGHALADAILESRDDHLWILPLRAPVARPREFLAGAGWSCAMARIRREFDLVLIDGSPIFTGLSAAVPHRSADAAILVHNPSMAGERSILRAREALVDAGIPLLGLAETFV